MRAYYRSRTWTKLLVVDKQNGGTDLLNVGLDAARFPYVLACDADTLIEPDAPLRSGGRSCSIRRSVAGGTIRVVNACTVRVDAWWKRAGGHALALGHPDGGIPGGVPVRPPGLEPARRQPHHLRRFRSLPPGDYLTEILGYATSTVTEDFELIVRLQRHLRDQDSPARVVFIPDPVAWTEVPTSIAVLGRQRERWHRGIIATMVAHRRLLFNPSFGATGLYRHAAFPVRRVAGARVELGLVITVLCTIAGVLSTLRGGLLRGGTCSARCCPRPRS
ncbi:MAG: glycosyltransferase family 2 protein [Vicinamibacterales bacterium]